MTRKLYQFAILYHGRMTKAIEEEGKEPESRILVEPRTILAKDDKEALIVAARQVPEEYLQKLSQVEIAIRPF